MFFIINKCSIKILEISQKTPVLESLFNKIEPVGLQIYYKETPTQVFSGEI